MNDLFEYLQCIYSFAHECKLRPWFERKKINDNLLSNCSKYSSYCLSNNGNKKKVLRTYSNRILSTMWTSIQTKQGLKNGLEHDSIEFL